MSNDATPQSAQPALRVVDAAVRLSTRTAGPRCACYAAWSELLASPHEVDVRESLQQKLGIVSELDTIDCALDEIIRAYLEQEPLEIRRQYSGLFEVGSDGPPVPIREDLQAGQRSGTREDLVRFYDYFDYRLDQGFAWQPDHLSVELEFMHYLCYGESRNDDNVSSFQLAQADFSTRHLANWVPQLSRKVERVSAGTLFSNVLAGLSDFLLADLRWQNDSIREMDAG
ncbi:MAG TPA: hypothetical protein ENK16_06050 [Chromatiales bacterium]|nr:hypothetical protein [Chromatiales bacterium]